VGIYKPVYLRGWDEARIINSYFKIEKLNESKADINLELTIETVSDTNCYFQFEVDTKEYTKNLKLKKGKHHYSIPFSIDKPELWWVHTLGKPNMYKFKGRLIFDGEIGKTYHTSFGLRKIQLLKKKDKAGESFGFLLNGKNVFMKGANYVPQDVFLSRVDSNDYRELLQQVVDANMNMLRVWGGGVYERDLFYDLCDRYGILVWQDFMFANAMYAAEQKFIRNIRNEAEYQVKRLRNHPCIALWCGNNEIDEAWHNWGWSNRFSKKDSAKLWADYQYIFQKLLPEIVKQHNPSTDYITTSPKFGRGDNRSLYQGDSHYWGVWHDGYDFSVFDSVTGRFMSEYGFQAFPPLTSVRQFVPQEELTLESEKLSSHQKHSRGMQIIRNYMGDYYYIPDSLQDFIYVSQLLQAEGIRGGIESHRRKKPYCMGTLYWQLNDCWPAISWSSIDYYGQWKALHYYAKKAYKNTIVSIKREEDQIMVYLINDAFKKYDGTLDLKLIDFEGNVLWSSQKQVKLGKDTSQIAVRISIKEWQKQYKLSKLVFQTKFVADGKQIDNYLYYFEEPRELQLQDPKIQFRVSKKNKILEVSLTCDRLAKNVYLSTPFKGNFSNNYFDMLPGIRYKVNFPANIDKEEFRNSLKVKTLNEINMEP
jgi:beta-mannosidase